MTRRVWVLWLAGLVWLAGCGKVITWDDTPAPVDPIQDVQPVASGLRVLIIHETGDQPSASRGQLAILASTKVNAYLSEHCSNGWRKLDKDGLAGVWKELADAAKPKSFPWLIVADGNRIVHSDALPADVESFLSLMGKFNG